MTWLPSEVGAGAHVPSSSESVYVHTWIVQYEHVCAFQWDDFSGHLVSLCNGQCCYGYGISYESMTIMKVF